jgi:hypothetical protein
VIYPFRTLQFSFILLLASVTIVLVVSGFLIPGNNSPALKLQNLLREYLASILLLYSDSWHDWAEQQNGGSWSQCCTGCQPQLLQEQYDGEWTRIFWIFFYGGLSEAVKLFRAPSVTTNLCCDVSFFILISYSKKLKLNSVALVHKLPPLVGEVSANLRE